MVSTLRKTMVCWDSLFLVHSCLSTYCALFLCMAGRYRKCAQTLIGYRFCLLVWLQWGICSRSIRLVWLRVVIWIDRGYRSGQRWDSLRWLRIAHVADLAG